jgi:hypothetical protein
MGMFQLMQSHFIFLDSVKAILVHCAHRLLSESTLILCTGIRPVEGKRPVTSPGLRNIPEPHAFSTVVFYGLKILLQNSAILRDTLQILSMLLLALPRRHVH